MDFSHLCFFFCLKDLPHWSLNTLPLGVLRERVRGMASFKAIHSSQLLLRGHSGCEIMVIADCMTEVRVLGASGQCPSALSARDGVY